MEGIPVKRREMILTVALVFSTASASAETPSEVAQEMLKGMTSYMSGLKTFSFDFSADIDAVTTEGVKLQFSGSGQVLMQRPAKFRLSRRGGHGDVEVVSDGKTVTLLGRRTNTYAQEPMVASFDAFVDAHGAGGVDLPGSDLLLENVHEELTKPVTESMYLGMGVIDGRECEHLAFRTPDVDWQIWIATGDKPYPCQYVVTSKKVKAAPEYQVRIHNWNDSPKIKADAFAFKPPAGAKKVDVSTLEEGTGLLLPETPGGAKK